MLKNWRAEALKHPVALSLCSSTVLLLVISLTRWCGPDVYALYSVVINKTCSGFLCYCVTPSRALCVSRLRSYPPWSRPQKQQRETCWRNCSPARSSTLPQGSGEEPESVQLDLGRIWNGILLLLTFNCVLSSVQLNWVCCREYYWVGDVWGIRIFLKN